MLQNHEVTGDLDCPTKFLFKVTLALELCVCPPSKLWAKHKWCHIKLVPTQHLVYFGITQNLKCSKWWKNTLEICMGPIEPQASNSAMSEVGVIAMIRIQTPLFPAATCVCEPQLLQNNFQNLRIPKTCLTCALERSQATAVGVPPCRSSSHPSSPLSKNSDPEPMVTEWGNKLK